MLTHLRIYPVLFLLLFLAFGCGNSEDTTLLPATNRPAVEADSNGFVPAAPPGPPETATVRFGLGNVADDLPRGHPGHHAADSMVPRTVVISENGSVTFMVDGFHQVAIYDPSTTPDDIDTSGGGPFINDETDRLALGELRENLTYTFETPGRYLVICNIRGHFVNNDMFGWVIVQ